MSSIIVFLLLSSVAVLGFNHEVYQPGEELHKAIKRAKEDIANVQRENEELSKLIQEETRQYKSKVAIDENLKNKGNAENIAQIETIEKLYQEYTNLTINIDNVTQATEDIKKIKLNIEVIQDDIAKLDKRRENGMTRSCMALEKMTKSSSQQAQPSVLSSGRVDDTIVLENELRLLMTELEQVTNKREELKKELSDLRAHYVLLNSHLKKELESIGENLAKGRESIAKLEEALAEKKQKIIDHAKSSDIVEQELVHWKKQARKALDKYALYALDVACYKQLFNDVNGLLFPSPSFMVLIDVFKSTVG